MSLQIWGRFTMFYTVHDTKSLESFRVSEQHLLRLRIRITHSIGKKGVQDAKPGPVLDWMQRVTIAVDAAKGLEFLHEKVKPPIIHRDIRSSNVLLWDDFRAKIGDFNLSNQPPDMAARLHSTRVLGTFGYHAPE